MVGGGWGRGEKLECGPGDRLLCLWWWEGLFRRTGSPFPPEQKKSTWQSVCPFARPKEISICGDRCVGRPNLLMTAEAQAGSCEKAELGDRARQTYGEEASSPL